MEERGLKFIRYADDSNIFFKSEMAANRVMKSVISWLERKLFLKVSVRYKSRRLEKNCLHLLDTY